MCVYTWRHIYRYRRSGTLLCEELWGLCEGEEHEHEQQQQHQEEEEVEEKVYSRRRKDYSKLTQ